MEIKVNNVSYAYDDINDVIHNITTTFKSGSISGIIGKTGSGKTTFTQMMDAFYIPRTGMIQMGSYKISKQHEITNIKSLRFDVGYVFQFPEEQFFNETVEEEIAFGLTYFNYKLDKLEKHISDALKMVGLDDSYLKRSPYHLSNGEKRKIAIASILAFNPKCLILDEPLVGLDENSKKQFLKLLRILKKRYHKTILIISHDIDLLHQIIDDVYVFHEGKLVMAGDKYKVFKEVEELHSYGIEVPKIILFSHKVLKNKNIKIGYRDEINDLMKDIYRYAK